MQEVQEILETAPSRYRLGPCKTIDLQGFVTKNCFDWYMLLGKSNIPDLFARIWSIGAIVKHVSRLGLKDDIDIELMKIEDYAHHARTGKFIGDEKDESRAENRDN